MDEHYNYHSSRKASNRTCIFLDKVKDHQIHSKPSSLVPIVKERLPSLLHLRVIMRTKS